MSRLIMLLLFVLLIGGAAYFLSTLPQKSEMKTIEVDVAPAANAN